jgi:ferredoxin-NADP reductase
MKVNVKGHLRDLWAFRGLVGQRKKRFKKASAAPVRPAPVNQLAASLHPGNQYVRIAEIRDETRTTRTFRLTPDAEAGTKALAHFRAGQYLSFKVQVDGASITRPYSISSAPFEAGEFYEITLKKEPGGFMSEHVWQNWQVGTRLRCSGPCGEFYYEPLRDAPRLVGLAGGSGVTPFRSLARAIAHGDLDAQLLLLYGSSAEDDIIFYDELKELELKATGKFKVVHVLSCEEVSLAGCEQGFITAELVRQYADVQNSSFFVCGPPAMYEFVEKELAGLDLPRKRVRRELYGVVKDVTRLPGYPAQAAGQTFQLTVHVGGASLTVPAQAAETVLVALERANLRPPSQCRSGECGFCRARLISGEVFVSPEGDGRRAADKQYGYIHPCASFPLGDLEIEVPRE